jgi:hypothetical protein
MKLSPFQVNLYLLFKLPSAFFCGVRVKTLNNSSCVVSVRYNWFNKNPFKSMYFAVQMMAAELTTGALMLEKIKESKSSISMLVASNKATFSKKAIGRISFECNEGEKIKVCIDNAIKTGEGQSILLHSIGKDEQSNIVSEMQFEWTVKVKTKQ